MCSYKDNNYIFFTPKAIIRMEINGVWDDYPVQWDERTFILRSEADKYALLKAKEWLSRNSNIKLGRIFTEEEWFIHRLCLIFLWIIGIGFGLALIFGIISSG